jgi:capsid protein
MSRLKTQIEIVSGRKYSFGYNAVEDSTKRRNTTKKTTPEISILTPSKRETASATAREDRRNFSILAWMIRRHLDNVSRFTPHFRMSGDSVEIKDVNAKVKMMLDWHSRRRQFDALGRHGRDEWLRMFEACKVIEGDAAGLKVSGGKLQGIEGDRIKKPSDWGNTPPAADVQKSVSDDGIVFSEDGQRRSFCLCRRNGSAMQFERIVPEQDMVFDGYWPDRFDSNRGVSPLLTALNEGADIRETWEWLVVKAKASAIFGLAFTRTGSDDLYPTQGDPNSTAPTSEAAAYTDQVGKAVKARGLINLDLDPGDDVKEIQSSTPNPTVIPFTRELIRSVLLALDIPFTFYDSLTASFSARIADRNEYEESCEWKREKNVSVLDEIYGGWLIPTWAKADIHGFGTALEKANIQPEEIAAALRWVPAGRPWLDRSNEMSGHILALAAGATSTPRICAAYGDDAYEIAEEQKEYLAKCGVPILYAQGGQVPVNDLLKQVRDGQVPSGQQPAEPKEEEDTNE